MNAGLVWLVSAGATFAVSPLVLAGLRWQRLVDVPNARSLHRELTPRGGGLAVAVGCGFGIAASASGLSRPELVVGAVAFGLLGFADDIHHAPAMLRLLAQGLLAAAMVPLLLAGVRVPALWQLVLEFGVLIWLVSYVNAFNFMDGINGLSTVQAVIAGIYWGVIGVSRNAPALAAGGFVIAGAAAGFLPFNFPRARMFLGDVGSYFIGCWLATLVILGLRARVPVEAMVGPVAVYLADTSSTMIRRIFRGQHFLEAHREHVYQRLVAFGWSHARTTGCVGAAITVCCLLSAVTLAVDSGVSRVAVDLALCASLAIYVLLPRMIGKGFIGRAPSGALELRDRR
jgi:UDP-N-acetylmuramyl pentapeptide phosphotransferase/UDP-N-acetylglucosamine-1-phosphate transferase